MFALLSAGIFGIAFLAASATLWMMFTTYGAKMTAALRMEHVPAANLHREQDYQRIRTVRTVLVPRTAMAPARSLVNAA